MASEWRKQFGFAHTYDAGLAKEVDVPVNSVVVMIAPYLKHPSEVDNALTIDLVATAALPNATEVLQEFIINGVAPRVGHMSPRSFGKLYRHKRPLLIGFVSDDVQQDMEESSDPTLTWNAKEVCRGAWARHS